MGLSNSNVALLLAAKSGGANFSESATLGAQTFWPFKKELQALLGAFGHATTAPEIFEKVGTNGSRFLEYLGANRVTEFDASDYEGAQAVHDMNTPLPEQWHGKFDFVFDGGSIEHIYNVPQVVENLWAMLKAGGHLALSTSGNNQLGHGFYQFSPEFFYRTFSRRNGWNTKLVMLVEHQKRPPRFWAVVDPEKTGRRIEIQTSSQLLIMMIAEKVARPGSFRTPQQSDYSAAWRGKAREESDQNAATPRRALWYRAYKRGRWEFIKLRRKFFPARLHPRSLTHPAKGLRQPGLQRLSLSELASCMRKS